METPRPATALDDVQLRDVTEEDLPILYVHQIDAESNRMADVPARDREGFKAHWGKLLDDDSVITKAILFRGKVAGHVCFFVRDGEPLVGYWLAKELWGKGIASAALPQFLRVARRRPLYAHVAKHNLGSVRVLEKCGFQRTEKAPAAEWDGLLYVLDPPAAPSP